MKLVYLGHSSILFVTRRGSRIVIDPYNLKVNKKFPQLSADVVLISHLHPDHNGSHLVGGNPKVLRRTTEFLSSFEVKTSKNEIIEFLAVPSFHDEMEGRKYGPNTIWVFSIDGIRIAHCGDLGHILKEQQIKEIGVVDILVAPIGGGGYTIGPKEFLIVMEQLKSMISIPVHYKTSFTSWINCTLDDINYPGKQVLQDFYVVVQSLPQLPKIFIFPEEVWDKIPEIIDEEFT